MKYLVVVFTLIFFSPGIKTIAQSVINIEEKRLDIDSIGWAGDATLGFILNKYREQTVSLFSNAHVQHRNRRNWFLLYGSVRWVRAAEENFVNDGVIHFRYNYELKKWIQWEAFTQVQFNKILDVEERVLAGTGPRFDVASSDKVNCTIGTLYMFEYEEQSPPARVIERNHRLGSYLSLVWNFGELSHFSTTFYYQPRLDKWSDYRLSGNAELEIGISEKFSWVVSFSYLDDSSPAGDSPRDVYTLGNSLRVSL